MRGMSPAAAAKKRIGVSGGAFAFGCGCKDAKAVAVATSSSSPHSTDASTATSATWRRARAAHPSTSGTTGTLTVPPASSSSFPWGDGEEVNCKRESFSGLLRQLNELEQNVVSWGRKSTCKQSCLCPPPPRPPPVPSRSVVKQRVVHSGDRHASKEDHDFSPPPPPPSPPPPPFHYQIQQQQQNRKANSMDKGDRQELAALLRQPSPPSPPLPSEPEKPTNMKSMDKVSKQKDDAPLQQQQQQPLAPKLRKAKSSDGRLDRTVAVVKQSDDPLSDFRRSMVNMIVENRIVTGDELRELLRQFLALNAPHHHDAILRAFTEIWDEAFSFKAQHRESARRPTPPRPRAPPPPPPQRRARHTTRAWR